MITRLIIENFKGFERIDVPLGPLNVLIGPNASGKSNFLEALRVLQGLARGLTVHEVFDGQPETATGAKWDGIRGGAGSVLRSGSSRRTIRLEAEIEFEAGMRKWRYAIELDPTLGVVIEESIAGLNDDGTPDLEPELHVPVGRKPGARSWLSQQTHPLLEPLLKDSFQSQLHFDPSPELLRAYSPPTRAVSMGTHGERFAAVAKEVLSDSALKASFLAWMEELRPEQIVDILTVEGALREPMFALREAGTEQPTLAPVLSNGTLRFAAFVLAYVQPSRTSLLSLEEIENGIHAERLRVLVDLLTTMSRGQGIQTIVTTHAPRVLDWLDAEQLNHALWFRRREDGASDIKVVGTDPSVQALLQAGESIGDLYAEGWMESAL